MKKNSKNFISIIFSMFAIIFFIASFVLYLCLYVDIKENINLSDKYILMISLTLSILSILCFIIAIAFIPFYSAKRMLAFYSKNKKANRIYNDIGFKLKVSKLMKNNYNKNYVLACVEIKNYDDNIIVNYGYDIGRKLILKSLFTVEKYYKKNHNLVLGTNGALLYIFKPYIDENDIINDIHEIENEINNEISELDLKIKISLAAGVCYNVKAHRLSADELLDRANIARYKKIGVGNDIIVYSQEMAEENKQELIIMNEIQRGIKNNEFEVYYQPKFDVHLNKFVGSEALVRWSHPIRGFVKPGYFIPIAEKTGIIVDLNRYIFRRICEDINYFKKTGTRLLYISLNFSFNDMQRKDFIPFLKSTIKEFNINPHLIEIEITEAVAAKDNLFAIALFKELKQIGFRLAMDDFGTCYSSLSYLKKLPIDTIKVDKSFFDDIEIDKKSRDIVTAIFEMSKALDLYIVSEGIENQKQANFIKKSKCDCVQGFYYSKPLSKNDYINFLANNRFEKGR